MIFAKALNVLRVLLGSVALNERRKRRSWLRGSMCISEGELPIPCRSCTPAFIARSRIVPLIESFFVISGSAGGEQGASAILHIRLSLSLDNPEPENHSILMARGCRRDSREGSSSEHAGVAPGPASLLCFWLLLPRTSGRVFFFTTDFGFLFTAIRNEYPKGYEIQ